MKSIIVILLSTISLSLIAQEKSKDHKNDYMPIMTRGIGASFQKFDGLNNRLAGFPQYETLKNHMWTLSLGSMHVRKNFISQLTVTGGSSLSGDRDKKSSALRFLSGGLDFGYDVIPAEKVMLYPLIGIGAETYHAIFYKDNSAVAFNDVLLFPDVQNSIRSVKFMNTFITYRLGLGIALKSPKHSGTIGIQAGYTGSFKDKAWKSSENQTLNAAPVDDLSRFSVSLVFGGSGGMMMK
ncbi:MAG: hypothetical protein ABI741_00410 [Ferruginibacter sp.]